MISLLTLVASQNLSRRLINKASLIHMSTTRGLFALWEDLAFAS